MTWLLQNGSPIIQIHLLEPLTGFPVPRILLADTGAGPHHAPFELVLSGADARRFSNDKPGDQVGVGGAIPGQFPTYIVQIEIRELAFTKQVAVLAVPAARLPEGTNGIAAFRFLNRFTYGNFGEPHEFGLELPATPVSLSGP